MNENLSTKMEKMLNFYVEKTKHIDKVFAQFFKVQPKFYIIEIKILIQKRKRCWNFILKKLNI